MIHLVAISVSRQDAGCHQGRRKAATLLKTHLKLENGGRYWD